MRAAALARVLVLRHFRSPLLLALVLVFVIAALGMPRAAGGYAAQARALGASATTIGDLLLLVLAVFVPFASIRPRRLGMAGGIGPFGVQGASLAAHALVILLAATLLGLAATALVSGVLGWPEARGREAVVRRVVGRGPAAPVRLGPSAPEAHFELPFDGLAREWPEVRLRLEPRWRYVPAIDEVGEGPLDHHLDVRARVRGTAAWLTATLAFTRRGARDVELVLPRGRTSGVLEVVIRRRPGPFEAQLAADAALLLGTRESLVSSLVRALLGSACGAISLMGAMVVLSSIVSGSIALAASLTLALAAAVVLPWLPGPSAADLGGLLASGLAVGWREIAPGALKAVLWLGVAALLPVRDPRLGGRA